MHWSYDQKRPRYSCPVLFLVFFFVTRPLSCFLRKEKFAEIQEKGRHHPTHVGTNYNFVTDDDDDDDDDDGGDDDNDDDDEDDDDDEHYETLVRTNYNFPVILVLLKFAAAILINLANFNF